MFTFQKNWKLWFAAALTTIALQAGALFQVAYACVGGGSGGTICGG